VTSLLARLVRRTLTVLEQRATAGSSSGAPPPAAPPPQAHAVDPLGEIRTANEKLRDTAKWIITSFAAIGAILLAGIQLSNVGKLTADTSECRVAAVIAGVVLAILGIGVAMAFTSRVLAPFLNTFRSADEHPDVTDRVLGDGELIGLTYGELKTSVREVKEAVRAAQEASGDDSEDPTLKEAERAHDEWEDSRRLALAMIGRELLWQRYERSRRMLIWVALPLTAFGLAVFAWGANPPAADADQSSAVLERVPKLVFVKLSNAGVDALRERRRCSRPTLQALTISGDPGAVEVVTIPAGGCEAVRFVLTPGLGTPTAP